MELSKYNRKWINNRFLKIPYPKNISYNLYNFRDDKSIKELITIIIQQFKLFLNKSYYHLLCVSINIFRNIVILIMQIIMFIYN